MSLAPEVQRKAQAELDAELGSRLPVMDDLPSFPFIQAILLEIMRLGTVAPLGVAHRLLDGDDDEFRGYIIPAGSTIIPVRRAHTIQAMLHDPIEYPNPEQFNPERFLHNGRLNPKVRDPLLAAFGFGRRICPGRYMAVDTLTFLFASLLSVFDVESTLPEGQRKLPEPTTSLISYPTDIPCRLKPRTAACIALINTEAQMAAANKAAAT
ncbi:hypothetical protein EIP86_007995 [Pleurotus ostreatoroseus]|nr:hypothetical protein EIP86_007995 [Pleurotus ostreatoroseus]